jgi:hypothetical protein
MTDRAAPALFLKEEFTMSSSLNASRVVKLFLALVLLLSCSLSAQESTATFVSNAYQAIGITPSCSQISLANDSLLHTNSRLDAAKRFVSTLFELPGSYDGQLSYLPTTVYTTHHGYFFDDQSFVQDLYAAFLQRPADPGGVSFWASQVPQIGYGGVITAFGVGEEFAWLVGSLQPTSVCCPVACSNGRTFNPGSCACQ